MIEKNRIGRKDFLTGKDEAEAFNQKNYVKLHQSTLRKVDVLSYIAHRVDEGSIKTDAKVKDFYGNYFVAFGEYLRENWAAAILIFLLTIAALIISIIGLVPIFFK